MRLCFHGPGWHGKGRRGAVRHTPRWGLGFLGYRPSTGQTDTLSAIFLKIQTARALLLLILCVTLCVTIDTSGDCALPWVRCGGAKNAPARHRAEPMWMTVGPPSIPRVHIRGSRRSARPASFLFCPIFWKKQTRGILMYVTIIATKKRDAISVHCIPSSAFSVGIDLTDSPSKETFINRFTGAGTALYRTLNNKRED